MAKILVVHKQPGIEAALVEVNDDVPSFRALVEGSLELVRLTGDRSGLFHRVDLWCNDEGKILELMPNIQLPNGDTVHGPFFLASYNDEGDTLGLPREQAIQLCLFFSRFS